METGAEGQGLPIPILDNLFPFEPAFNQPVGEFVAKGKRIAGPGQFRVRDFHGKEVRFPLHDSPRHASGEAVLW
jgi:hypothetical protein